MCLVVVMGARRDGARKHRGGGQGDREGHRKDRGTTLHRVCGVWLKAGEMENLWQGPAEQNRAGCWTETTGRTGKQEEWSEAMIQVEEARPRAGQW